MMHGKSGKLEVSDYTFYAAFISGSIILYLPALWAKLTFSERNCADAKYFGYLVYFVGCAFIHLNYLRNSYIPFIGEKDNSVMGWVSMLMILAYLCSFPEPWKNKGKFSRDPLSPINIMLPKLDRGKNYHRRILTHLKLTSVKRIAIYGVVTTFFILIWRKSLQTWLGLPGTELSIFGDGGYDTEKMITLVLYTLLTFALYLPSLWAKFSFSGDNFSGNKATAALIYNMNCALFHQIFLDDGHFLFLNFIDNSTVGWLSFFMIIAHTEALPYPWKRRLFFW